jgi:hypothetical protein
MEVPRFAFWLLARSQPPGVHDPLVGDLIEEIGRGRSPLWIVQELIGLYGLALLAYARRTVRVTQPLVSLAVGVILVGAAWLASIERVVETWTSVYYIAGTISLFAHVVSRTTASRVLFTQEADRRP